MSKHTPGPWIVTVEYSFGGDFIKYVLPRATLHVSEAEAIANAGLIAVAPEMFDQLKSLQEWLEDEIGDWLPVASCPDRIQTLKQKLTEIKLVIQKAKGGDRG